MLTCLKYVIGKKFANRNFVWAKKLVDTYHEHTDNPEYIITKSQQEIIDEFLGISDMLTPIQLKELLMQLYDL